MLNLFKKKSGKNGGVGSRGEPPILMVGSDGVSLESIRYVPRQHKKMRPRSEMFERNAENGVALINDQWQPLHMTYSTSLDETRFADVQSGQNGNYTRNSSNCSHESGSENRLSESPNKASIPPSEEPAKYYSSPKCVPKFAMPHRSSGRNWTHSESTGAISSISDRASGNVARGSNEHTPRMYKKNCQQRTFPQKGTSTDVSFDGSTVGSFRSGSRESFSDDVSSSPVPPPRRKRTRLTENGGDRLSNAEEKLETLDSPESDHDESLDAFESTAFNCSLPADFSDLGLDILKVAGGAGVVLSEPSGLGLAQTVNKDEADSTLDTENSTNADNYTSIKSGDVLTITPPTCQTSDCESTVPNLKTISPGSSDSVLVLDNNDVHCKNFKLRSETIVQSIFGKGRKQPSVVANRKPVESKGSDFVTTDEASQTLHETRINPQDSSQSNGLMEIPEFLNTTAQDSRSYSRYLGNTRYLGNSLDEDSPPVSHDSSWGNEFPIGGDRTLKSMVTASQPDVLIGTQRMILNSSDTSRSSSFDECEQQTYRRYSLSRTQLPNKEIDVHVLHELHGFQSKTQIKISESSISRDVVERLLLTEQLPTNWNLYRLRTKVFDSGISNGSFVELDPMSCPATYLTENNRNIQFELIKKDEKPIRVSCKTGHERPRTITIGISPDDTCRILLEIAVKKFGFKRCTNFCLIQVDRSRKDCPTRRVAETEIIARLHTDYFLLCEREYFPESSSSARRGDACDGTLSTRSRPRPSYVPSQASIEADIQERRVAELEAKLAESEKHWQQQLMKQQNQVDRYKSIAFCTASTDKISLLEVELQRLTREVHDVEKQVQAQKNLCWTMSSVSKDEQKRQEEKLLTIESSLSAVTAERKEVYELLFKVTAEKETQQRSMESSKTRVPPLYNICHRAQGCCLYGFELRKSRLNRVELLPPGESNDHCLSVGRSNGCIQLTPGDKIIEINGEPVHHLNEKELISIIRGMTDILHVVVLRDESRTNNVYML